MIDVKVTGLAELQRTLAALPAALQSRVLRGMVSTGAAVIKNEAILRAPVYTGPVQQGHPPAGTLKRAIYQTRMTELCSPTREVWKIDVRKGLTAAGAKGGTQDAYYATWVEYGHQVTARSSTVGIAARRSAQNKELSVGQRQYMRPAFESKKQACSDAMGTYLTYKLADAVKFAKG